MLCPKCNGKAHKNRTRPIRRKGVIGKNQSYKCGTCKYQWEIKIDGGE
jgi:transposase-like protein